MYVRIPMAMKISNVLYIIIKFLKLYIHIINNALVLLRRQTVSLSHVTTDLSSTGITVLMKFM